MSLTAQIVGYITSSIAALLAAFILICLYGSTRAGKSFSDTDERDWDRSPSSDQSWRR